MRQNASSNRLESCSKNAQMLEIDIANLVCFYLHGGVTLQAIVAKGDSCKGFSDCPGPRTRTALQPTQRPVTEGVLPPANPSPSPRPEQDGQSLKRTGRLTPFRGSPHQRSPSKWTRAPQDTIVIVQTWIPTGVMRTRREPLQWLGQFYVMPKTLIEKGASDMKYKGR